MLIIFQKSPLARTNAQTCELHDNEYRLIFTQRYEIFNNKTNFLRLKYQQKAKLIIYLEIFKLTKSSKCQ